MNSWQAWNIANEFVDSKCFPICCFRSRPIQGRVEMQVCRHEYTLWKCTRTPSLWPVLQVWVRNDLRFRISIARCIMPVQCPRGSCWCSRPSFNERDHDFAWAVFVIVASACELRMALWSRRPASSRIPRSRMFPTPARFWINNGLHTHSTPKKKVWVMRLCGYAHDPLLILFYLHIKANRLIINAGLDLQEQSTTLVIPCSAHLAERRIATSFGHHWRSTSLCGMSRKATTIDTIVWTPSHLNSTIMSSISCTGLIAFQAVGGIWLHSRTLPGLDLPIFIRPCFRYSDVTAENMSWSCELE